MVGLVFAAAAACAEDEDACEGLADDPTATQCGSLDYAEDGP